MIKKERKEPLQLKKLESTLRLLLPHHPKRHTIEEDLKNFRAGYRGERELDYHLSFLPDEPYHIYQGLRLPGCQIDAFVLSTSFAVIIECKNLSGTLTFSHQLTREKANQKQGFSNPILQAQRQRIMLLKWMDSLRLKPLPIHCLVAVSFPSSIIEFENDHKHLVHQVTHAEGIPFKIEEWNGNKTSS